MADIETVKALHRRIADLEMYNLQPIGYCTSCMAQPRLVMHCDGCGAHDIGTIKINYYASNEKALLCTGCFHKPRLAHHCDTCTGPRIGNIITLDK